MALSAYLNGWSEATISGDNLPTLEEMQALNYINTTQLAYLFQEGIPEYDAETTYFQKSMVKKAGTYEIYGSVTDDNTGNALSNPTYWTLLQNMAAPSGTIAANTVLVNNTGSTAAPVGLALASNTLLGRGASGNIVAITLGTNLSFSGGVLNGTASNPTGAMIDFAGTSVPTGYLGCDGSAVSRTTYADLFTAIGTTWGVGDGSTTFNLPDFRRRTAIGSGGSGTGTIGNAVGNVGGEETHVLTTGELPTFNLTVNRTTGGGGATTTFEQVTNSGSSTDIATSSIGSNTPFNVMQPSAVVLKIIKT